MKKLGVGTIFSAVMAGVIGFGLTGCYRPDEGYTAIDPGELPAKVMSDEEYEKEMLKPYDKEITITVAAIDYPVEGDVPASTTPENQSFNRIVKEKLNINLKYTVVSVSSTYDQALQLAVGREGGMPDMFYTTNVGLFSSLRSQGKLADLGPSFWYLNKTLQDIYLNVAPDVLKNVMQEGHLYSFPMTTNTYESAQKLYIRKDWLEACGEAVPEELTMDGLIALGEKFIEKGGDIVSKTGLTGTKAEQLIPLAFHNEVMWTGTASSSGIMQACGASPDAYFEGEDGRLYASNTSSEMKEALGVMQTMYKKGIIDKQFTTKNVDAVYSDIKSGKVGMVFGQWWLPNGEINKTVSAVKGADWISVDLPTYNDKKPLPIVKRVNLTGYNLVSSKCAYPEAAAKIINLFYDVYYNNNAEEIYGADSKQANGFYHNMVPIKVWNAKASVEEYKRVNEVFKKAHELGIHIKYDAEGKLTADSWTEGKATEAQLAEYNKLAKREKEQHWKLGYPYYCAISSHKDAQGNTVPGMNIKDMPAQTKKGWGIYRCMIADDCGYDQVARLTEDPTKAKYDEFYGPQLTMMEQYGGYLSNTLSKEVYMKIITGEKDVSYFDTYVSDYAKNGGDKIIKQINLWYDAHKKK